jgi:hypothetical protein
MRSGCGGGGGSMVESSTLPPARPRLLAIAVGVMLEM